MADLDLVRDVLDEQLVDARERAIGKADGVVIEVRPGEPPRVAAIEVGITTLAYRLHPAAGRWMARFSRWMGVPGDGAIRLPFRDLEIRDTEIKVPVDGDACGLFWWERWVRRRFTRHLPGGR